VAVLLKYVVFNNGYYQYILSNSYKNILLSLRQRKNSGYSVGSLTHITSLVSTACGYNIIRLSSSPRGHCFPPNSLNTLDTALGTDVRQNNNNEYCSFTGCAEKKPYGTVENAAVVAFYFAAASYGRQLLRFHLSLGRFAPSGYFTAAFGW